jgi:hypothetical protein
MILFTGPSLSPEASPTEVTLNVFVLSAATTVNLGSAHRETMPRAAANQGQFHTSPARAPPAARQTEPAGVCGRLSRFSAVRIGAVNRPIRIEVCLPSFLEAGCQCAETVTCGIGLFYRNYYRPRRPVHAKKLAACVIRVTSSCARNTLGGFCNRNSTVTFYSLKKAE